MKRFAVKSAKASPGAISDHVLAGIPVVPSGHSDSAIDCVLMVHTSKSDLSKGERQASVSGSEILETGFEEPKPTLPRIDQSTKPQCAVTRMVAAPVDRSTPKKGVNTSVANRKPQGPKPNKKSKAKTATLVQGQQIHSRQRNK